MIDVTFQHWRYVFAEEELIRYGSPHFDRKSAGQALSASVTKGASRVASCKAAFDQKLILAANEVFPEAAVADPLADLEVWDEWRSGVRSHTLAATAASAYVAKMRKLAARRVQALWAR